MVKFIRVKGLLQSTIAEKTANQANELIKNGYKIISITQYADSTRFGRHKAATIYYTK